MKKIVSKPSKVEKVVEIVTETVDSVVETNEDALFGLLGKPIYVMCASYAYSGKLTGVNDRFIEVSDPSIVYETGAWNSKDWKDAQKLPTDKVSLSIAAIEVIFEVKR